jgi:hypothetical protein
VQCHICQDFGHYQRDCPSEKHSQVNYLESEGYYEENYSNINDNKNNDVSAYLYCVLPSSKSYFEPLLINDCLIQKDVQFVLNAGKN